MQRTEKQSGFQYNNDGERLTHKFLKRLPEEYKVLREFLVATKDNYKRPDFVVLNSKIGLMIIDAKDWDLTQNAYRWLGQEKIEKKRLSDGKTEILEHKHNPFIQAEIYKFIFMDLLKKLGINSDTKNNVFVSSTICFPRISRQEFINSVNSNKILKNPQSKFYVDFQHWIFRDDIEQNTDKPEKVLLKIVNNIKHFRKSNPKDIIKTYNELLPAYTVVGVNTSTYEKSRSEIKKLSEEQMNWVLNKDKKENFLLDLPGSGKTSALISKAIYMKQIDVFEKQLIVTYSKNLKQNLHNLLKTKIRNDKEFSKIAESVNVFTTEELIELVYEKVDEDKTTKLSDIIEIIEEDIDDSLGLKIFDSILIDEIQDFDNEHLRLLQTLVKEPNYFFVGDLSQKIYERQPDLERLGFDLRKIELPKTYRMYRTPKNIAKVALNFLLKNKLVENELRNNNYYLDNIDYLNPIEDIPEIHRLNDEKNIIDKINSFNYNGYNNEQIMIITSDKKIELTAELLEKNNIDYELEYSGALDKIALVNFENSKGLEKEVVIIYGIEDLYNRFSPEAVFDKEVIKQNKESYSIRKIYIALTRTLEKLVIYYEDSENIFIKELIKQINNLTNKILQ